MGSVDIHGTAINEKLSNWGGGIGLHSRGKVEGRGGAWHRWLSAHKTSTVLEIQDVSAVLMVAAGASVGRIVLGGLSSSGEQVRIFSISGGEEPTVFPQFQEWCCKIGAAISYGGNGTDPYIELGPDDEVATSGSTFEGAVGLIRKPARQQPWFTLTKLFSTGEKVGSTAACSERGFLGLFMQPAGFNIKEADPLGVAVSTNLKSRSMEGPFS